MFYSTCCILISSFFPSKASYSLSSVQLLIPSPAGERMILNFQFKGVLWCLSEHQLLYFCINWWQCFQVSVVWNQAWNTSTLEFHHSKNPGIIHLPKWWYRIKFPSHTRALGLSHHFLSWLMKDPSQPTRMETVWYCSMPTHICTGNQCNAPHFQWS